MSAGTNWIHVPAPLYSSSAILGKCFKFSEPLSPHLQASNNIIEEKVNEKCKLQSAYIQKLFVNYCF